MPRSLPSVGNEMATAVLLADYSKSRTFLFWHIIWTNIEYCSRRAGCDQPNCPSSAELSGWRHLVVGTNLIQDALLDENLSYGTIAGHGGTPDVSASKCKRGSAVSGGQSLKSVSGLLKGDVKERTRGIWGTAWAVPKDREPI